ncbi:hypothetical protein [Pandoraea pulmonicola]|nr:hypothetical protein [Pandoraea pulmonicola]
MSCATTMAHALVVLGPLLCAAAMAPAHAQSTPPATAPVDPFHQPCVAVHAEHGRIAPGSPRLSRIVRDATASFYRRYVDLENRCAALRSLAPTRDVDASTIWYVDARAHGTHAAVRPSGAEGLHRTTS